MDRNDPRPPEAGQAVPAKPFRWQRRRDRQTASGQTPTRRAGVIGTRQGWRRRFDDPIYLPNGRQLKTLMAAGDYITELPKAQHDAPE